MNGTRPGWAVRLVRALWPVVQVGVLLVGMPAVLLYLWGSPLPSHVPDWASVQRWLSTPDTARPALPYLIRYALWSLWLVLVFTVLARLTAGLRRVRRAQLHLSPPTQAGFSRFVGSVVLGSMSAHSASATPPPAPVPAPTVPADSATPSSPPSAVDVPSTAPTVTHRQAPRAKPSPGGIRLSEGAGWLAAELAVAVATLSTHVWLQRRRQYRPRSPGTGHLVDDDIQPLPRSMRLVATAIDSLPERIPPGGSLALRELPTKLALAGPGAADIARGLLLTVLLRAQSDRLTVACSDRALVNLLGPTNVALARAAGVGVLDDPEEQPNPDQVKTVSVSHVVADLLISTGSRQPDTEPGNVRHQEVLLVGGVDAEAAPENAMPVWSVSSTGVIRQSGQHEAALPGRLSALSQITAVEILGVLAQSRTGAAPQPTEAKPNGPAVEAPAANIEPVTASPAAPLPTIEQPPVASAGHRFVVRVLGPLRLTEQGGNGTDVELGLRATEDILLLLILHPDGPAGDELMEYLWPHVTYRKAYRRLHTALHRLRAHVRAGADGATAILRVDGRYRLDQAVVDVDLWRLQAIIRRASAIVDLTGQRQYWREAVRGYTGELAAGRSSPWLLPHREALRRQILDIVVSLAEVSSDPGEQLRLLRRAHNCDPLNEQLRQHILRSLPRLAGRADAKSLHHELTRHGEPTVETEP